MTQFMGKYMEMDRSALMKQEIVQEHHNVIRYFIDSLRDEFQSGLDSVYVYLGELSHIMRNFDGGSSFPILNVRFVESPTIYDPSNVSGPPSAPTRRPRSPSPSETPSSDSSSEFSGIPRRRGKKRKARERADHSRKESRDHRRDSQRGSPYYCDLSVTTANLAGHGKYVLLVEFLAHGASLQDTVRKIQEQMICVLQAQPAVYGAIFSEKQLVILMAKHEEKESGDEKEKPANIAIGQQSYNLFNSEGQFNVEAFQLFTMDIFAILVHGMLGDAWERA